jgi:hypothetical protein
MPPVRPAEERLQDRINSLDRLGRIYRLVGSAFIGLAALSLGFSADTYLTHPKETIEISAEAAGALGGIAFGAFGFSLAANNSRRAAALDGALEKHRLD